MNIDLPTQEQLDNGYYLPEMDIEAIQKLMEEMANAPKEDMGKRQPGERNAYERQRLEQGLEI